MRHTLRITLVLPCVLLATAQLVAAEKPVIVTGSVPADFPKGIAAPVVVPIPESLVGQMGLTGKLKIDGASAGEVTLQTEPADKIAATPARAWFMWTAKPDQLGRPIAIELSASQAKPSQTAACLVRYNDPLVEVTGPDKRPILAYRHGQADPKLKYPMTSYIHPLVGLDGEILTDCAPKDHPHHRGLFWSWVRIMRGDRLIGETWIPRDITVVPADVNVSEGPVLGRFSATHYWFHQPGVPAKPAATAPTESDRIIREDVVCRVFTSPEGRAIDLDLTLTALQDQIKIGGQTELNKGYGGLTLRFSTEQQGKAKNPRVAADRKQITEATVNRLKALWVDWTAIFNGPDDKPLPGRSGGAIFIHPSHPPLPASPPEWITRFYGPVGVGYPGLEMLELPQDKPMRLKYRVWIHRGDEGEGRVDEQYRAYAADWKWHAAQ